MAVAVSKLSAGFGNALLLVLTGALWAAGCQGPPSAGAAASPIVIAHRGASGHRPEHTLGAYRFALLQGADFIEPDLVATRDGVLIARHENLLAEVQLDGSGGPARGANGGVLVTQATTDVAEHPEFADRLTVKTLDGRQVGGWFTEDFTLPEIRRLAARERMPGVRAANRLHDDAERIPTLAEIIALVRQHETASGHRAGLYIELKHPTYFLLEGERLDGSLIGQDLGRMLLSTLAAEGFTDPERLFVQAFEIAALVALRREMRSRGLEIPLVQLMGDVGPRGQPSAPYDLRYHLRAGADLAAVYGDLAVLLPLPGGEPPTYADLISPEALGLMAATYANALGVPKRSVLPVTVAEPRDADGDGRALQRARLDGSVGIVVERARAAGLDLHAYTLRLEEPFLVRDGERVLPVAEEARRLLEAGVSGLFIDQPAEGVVAVDEYLRRRREATGSG